jgi:hypothetical protein
MKPIVDYQIKNARTNFKKADMLKGTAEGEFRDALRHGQRPEMWPSVST